MDLPQARHDFLRRSHRPFRGGAVMQLAAQLVGALAGWLLCQRVPPLAIDLPGRLRTRTGVTALVVFCLLLGLALTPRTHAVSALASIFYRAGALVFGGGHVVLPLLREALVPGGWLSDQAFLSGWDSGSGPVRADLDQRGA
jgi:chromate transporter